jgi:Rrf2 family protein
MLTLSKRVEYALMAILHMADARAGEWTSSKGIAERYSIPAELLGKVLQALARASIVASTPGVNGGYRLQLPLGKINLGMVIEAVEGPVILADCQENPQHCDQFHACTIKEPIQQIHAQLIRYLHSISLSQFRAPQPMENVQ